MLVSILASDMLKVNDNLSGFLCVLYIYSNIITLWPISIGVISWHRLYPAVFTRVLEPVDIINILEDHIF